jgi:hypothetical protein
LLAALLHRLPRQTLQRLRLLVRRTLSCVGTANCRRDATPWHPVRNPRGDFAPSGPSASLVLRLAKETPIGATAESTASFSSWA